MSAPRCVPCQDGEHDHCKETVYDPREDGHVRCGCWSPVSDESTKERYRRARRREG